MLQAEADNLLSVAHTHTHRVSVTSSTTNRVLELYYGTFLRISTSSFYLSYLAKVRTGRIHAVVALLLHGMFRVSADAPSQDTIRSTAHKARTIA